MKLDTQLMISKLRNCVTIRIWRMVQWETPIQYDHRSDGGPTTKWHATVDMTSTLCGRKIHIESMMKPEYESMDQIECKRCMRVLSSILSGSGPAKSTIRKSKSVPKS